MNTMNDIEVIINNKRYTLSGYESGEYLQKVASYINGKYTEFKETEAYNRLDSDMKNILIQINIADDYFKAMTQMSELEELDELRSSEVFDIKHEMIAVQTQFEDTKKELERLKKDYEEAQRQIIRLETELAESAKYKKEENKKNKS